MFDVILYAFFIEDLFGVVKTSIWTQKKFYAFLNRMSIETHTIVG